MKETIIEGLRNNKVGIYSLIVFVYEKQITRLKLSNLIKYIANDLQISEHEINKHSVKSALARAKKSRKKKKA